MSDRVLIVEDEDVLARSIAKFLSAKGFEVETAPDGIVAMQVLREQSFDAVATDIKMPRCDGIELLRRMRDAGCTEPTIVLSAHGTLERAVAAMKLGAQDFLRKPIDLDDLESVLRRSIATTRMRQELDYLRKRQVGPDEFPEPLGDSRAMRDIRRHLQQLASAQEAVAPGDSPPILVTGETGTGKSLIIRYFHRLVASPDAPFIEVNCAGLQPSLIESELFGHERGAFTDAKTSRKGLFEAAEGGTLYLDEIGHLDPEIQGNLLAAIEEKTIRRLGGTRSRHVNVRIVASTNADLEAAMKQGRFRSDLYFRLTAFQLAVPPLRERPEDIDRLAEHFLERLAVKYGAMPRTLAADTLHLLRSYDWPGNARQLRNLMEHAVVLAEGPQILPCHFPGISRRATGHPTPPPTPGHRTFTLPPEGIDFEDLESSALDQALERSGGNIAQAARLLGMSRSRFRYRLRRRQQARQEAGK